MKPAPIPFTIPCLSLLSSYKIPSGRIVKQYDTLFDPETLEDLRECSQTIKDSYSAQWNNNLRKLMTGNVSYLVGLAPAPVLYYHFVAQFTDFIKAHMPSFLEQLVPSTTPTDAPCLTPTWMNVAAIACGCCAFLSIANFTRKTAIQAYVKNDELLEKDIAYMKLQRNSQLLSMYDKAERSLNNYFENEAANDPDKHQQLWIQAVDAEKKLVYLREALAEKGLSPLESSIVLKNLTKKLKLIARMGVGLRNSKDHIPYNAKFLAKFPITPQTCIPHRARNYLIQSTQQKNSKSFLQHLFSAMKYTTLLTAPVTIAASSISPSANTALQTAKNMFACSENPPPSTTSCWEGFPTPEMKQTAAGVLATAFAIYAAFKTSKWAFSKIPSQKASSPEEMAEAVARTKEVYDHIAAYLLSEGPERNSLSASSSRSARHKAEEEKGSNRAAASSGIPASFSAEKIALAQAIQEKMTDIHKALAASRLKGCTPQTITEELTKAIKKILNR